MAVDLGEAAVLGAVGKIVAEMPFAEMPRGVAGVLKHLRHGDLVFPQHGTAVDGVPDAGAIGPMPCEQSRASRGAGRSDVVIGQVRGLGRERVEMGRLDDRIPRVSEITVTLVVGDNEDDVRALGGRKRLAAKEHKNRKGEKGEFHLGIRLEKQGAWVTPSKRLEHRSTR